jgi:hypothetical protein
MKTSRYFLGYLLSLAAIWPAHAADLSGLNKDMTYREVKSWHEQFLRGEPVPADRLEAMRSIVRTSQFGGRGLTRIYGNFEGNRSIDPLIRGVEQTVLLQRSASNSQAKGYRRELLYAIEFSNDPRFSLEEMNRALNRSWGNTDADIVIRHKSTGLYGRVEVKDVSLASQATNLTKYKGQMDKMALEARLTGQPQFWINRRKVHQDLQKYANEKGVVALGEVKTGRSPAGNEMSSKDAMNAVAKEMAQATQRRAIAGSTGLAYGAWMLVESVPGALDAFHTVLNSEARTAQAWRRLGEQGSYTMAGGGMTLSGGALLWSRYASEGVQGQLFHLSRIGGIASFAALGLGEAFLISRHVYGDVSSREFWTTQSVLGSALVGGIAGSWVGGAIGALWENPLTIDIGAVLGGAAGTWAGQRIGALGADYYYDWRFAKLDQEFGKFVYERYGVN